MSKTAEVEPEVDKRKVTMSNTWGLPDGGIGKEEATDFIRPDHLDAYVADARTKWQSVVVSDEPDAGPGGYHGVTAVPAHLDVPDAGVVYPATPGSKVAADLAAAEAAAAALAAEDQS